MTSKKIIRSICVFTDNPSLENSDKLDTLEKLFADNDYIVQTKRICSKVRDIALLENMFDPQKTYLSIGKVPFLEAQENLLPFITAKNTAFNIDLTNEIISTKHVDFLFDLIAKKSDRTFLFAYVFNNKPSSPYLPSASYEKNGFSIGLQPTDLSVDCKSIAEWLNVTKSVWVEIMSLVGSDSDFLGIDSSTAPLLGKEGSLIGMMNRFGYDFSQTISSDFFLQITDFIKRENPKPIGLCGLMIPCLEDTYLAQEYEKGNFTIERNIFLSLHSGLGIDVYPIGIDEKEEKILNVLKLIQGLSNKYNKPLSIRFVSDGKTKISQKTDFKNEFLKDVVIRAI